MPLVKARAHLNGFPASRVTCPRLGAFLAHHGEGPFAGGIRGVAGDNDLAVRLDGDVVGAVLAAADLGDNLRAGGRLSEAIKVAAVLGVGVLGIDELLDGRQEARSKP